MLRFSPALRATLALATNKADWCAALIAALGATRNVVIKRADAPDDVWGAGVTVFDGPATGEMSVSSGRVVNLGVMGSATTQIATNLGTGYAVVRVIGSDLNNWVEGTIGVTGSGRDFILRASPANGNTGFGFTSTCSIGAPANLSSGGAGGTVFKSFTIQNTSATAQAAGSVTKLFGNWIKPGDVPAGQHVKFELTDGTECPHTPMGIVTWPDGSLKFFAAMIRIPVSVAGSATITINLRNGASLPAAGARTLSDLTSDDINVELVGVTNLSGTWVASLNTAITDNTDIASYGNGPAGRVWRIGGPLKQSGSAHGQLHCWHFVQALQNAAGGLKGIRYLGRVAQPWGNVSTPTPDRRVATAVLKRGATTVRSLTGMNTNETVQANLGIGHYTSFFTAGTDGNFDYFQGSGTDATDTTLRVIANKTYDIATKFVASYDTALSVTSNSSVDYRPYGRAGIDRDMAGTGEREDIGILPGYFVRHLLTQSAVDERMVRTSGLSSGGWRQCARRSTTNQIIPVTDISASYAGLGTIQTTWRFRGTANLSGFVSPSTDSSLWISEYEPSHRPFIATYAYLVTGEPQFLDLMVEHASGMATMTIPGSFGLNTAATVTKSTVFSGGSGGTRDAIIGATTYKGGGILFENGLNRIPAWGTRDLCAAAAFYPDTCPWGTETRKYFREIVNSYFTAANAYNAARPSAWNNSGFWNFDLRDNQESPWCLGYLSTSICWQSSVLPQAAATTFRQHLSKYWQSMNANMDIACGIAYTAMMYDQTGTRIEDMANMVFSFDSQLTFDTGTSKATIGGTLNGWRAQAGDLMSFAGGTKPFAAATDYRRLYVVNPSGATFQLALTPGGSPETFTAGGSNYVSGKVASFAPHWSAEGYTGPMTYVATITAAIRYHRACGDTNVASAETNAAAKLAASGTSFTSNPRNAITTAYPA